MHFDVCGATIPVQLRVFGGLFEKLTDGGQFVKNSKVHEKGAFLRVWSNRPRTNADFKGVFENSPDHLSDMCNIAVCENYADMREMMGPNGGHSQLSR